ncbi:MAG: hypothetical protein GY927_08460 [bacterium]|nr:hypothetical protein [bacterium]
MSKKKVQVERRRRADDSGKRKRADAPQRRQSSSRKTSSRPSSSGGGGQRPSLPIGQLLGGGGGGRSPWITIIIVIVLLVFGGGQFFGGGDDGGGDVFVPQEPANNTSSQQQPVVVDDDFVPPMPASGDGQTWLIMLYQDADDKILEQDIYLDLNEAERIGSNDRVHIVAQIDRYEAGYRGDGNWSSARRYYVEQDNDLNAVNSRQLMDLGEVSMADGETLVDFVTWAAENFPADKHVLIMSDHGMGWPGGWSDKEPGGPGPSNVPLAQALGDQLYLNELDEALGKIRAQTDIDQFELIGFDACLMGHLEVFSAIQPHARYGVASQEVEPALGWAYTGFLGDLVQNPDMDGAGLSQAIIDSYIYEDQRIVDAQARAEFTRQGSPTGGLFGLLGGGGPSADQIARQLDQNITLTAVDLRTLPALMDSFNNFAYSLQSTNDQHAIAQARSYAQSFTSVFGKDLPPSYIDLGNFVQLVSQESGSREIEQAANDVLSALAQTVIGERHGPKKAGSTGLSIYFPNSQLYRNPLTGPDSYTVVAERFANNSLWDDFLVFHYTGRSFEQSAQTLALPDRAGDIFAPGGGGISVSDVAASANSVGIGETILLSTDIAGDNVGYVKLFVGFLDAGSNSIFVADSDYLESPETRQANGVFYPDWGNGDEFTMEFEWEPIVFAISDGVDSQVALFAPLEYGATFEDTTYIVDGIYTYADGGESRYARLLFQDGIMRQVFGFTDESGTGAPREITPNTGDSFTVLEKWLDLDGSGNVTGTAVQQGGTLTFGDQPFVWEVLDAAAGDYVVGFVVEDLDGNEIERFVPVTVE